MNGRLIVSMVTLGAIGLAVATAITIDQPSWKDVIMWSLIVLIVISQVITVIGRRKGWIR